MKNGWTWWKRLTGGKERRPGEAGALDAVARFRELLADSEDEATVTIASIPSDLRRRLQEEAVRSAFVRLEMPLRFLLNATTPGREPQSADVCHEILRLWRQGLEREICLVPDDLPNSVRPFERSMEREYNIHGRCRPGDPLRILIPCWRLYGHVVVRGEAEPVAPASLPSQMQTAHR